ncbi:MAG: polysaccharide deacetylase family protein [Flavobacteriaceae bacterium]
MLKRRVINPIAFVLLFGLIILNFFANVPWYSYLILLITWFLITLFGSFFIRWNYHLTSLNSNKKTTQNWVSITFDDGPDANFTPQILALLKKYEAKATFFCIGENIEKHPDLVRKLLVEGHSIGNHTYSHSKSFGFFNLKKVMAELEKSKSVVADLTGLQMKLYRPAFGVTNPSIEKAVRRLKLSSIGWNVRSLDTTVRSEAQVFKRISGQLTKGDIILLHDTSEKSVAVLERLLVFLHEKNLKSVTVERLLELEAYA